MARIYRQTGKVNEENEKPKYKKPGWYKKTERLLKLYKNLPAEIENLRLQLRMDQLAGQSITQQFRPVVTQHNSVSSPLESITIKETSMENIIERKEILLQMLENTIKTFNPEERPVYHLRYELEKRDKEVYTKLQISRSAYFELQKRVVLKAARLLNIPVPIEDQPPQWNGKLFESVPWS